MTVVGRYDRGDSRWYVHPLNSEIAYPSVTSILGAANSKSFLGPWHAKLAAEFAVAHHDLIGTTLGEVGPAAAVDLIKAAARRARDLKADIGSYVHSVIEALILDTPIPSPPDHLVDVEVDGETLDLDEIIDGFLAFTADHDPQWEMAEATVVNERDGYAGTLDFIAHLPRLGLRVLGDCKTGSALDAEINAQLAGYKRARTVWLDMLGNVAPMPALDRAVVLHLRREYEHGYKLFALDPAAEDAAYGWLLSCRDVLRAQQAMPKIKGRPLYPPREDGTQPAPLVEDVEHKGFNQFRGKLRAAGVRSLDDLAARTREQLLGLSGIGPAAVTACVEVLQVHGLTLAEETRAGVA
jgi:hypothetical protein